MSPGYRYDDSHSADYLHNDYWGSRHRFANSGTDCSIYWERRNAYMLALRNIVCRVTEYDRDFRVTECNSNSPIEIHRLRFCYVYETHLSILFLEVHLVIVIPM